MFNIPTFKILIRKAKKRFLTFALNIAGLSLGISSVIFIAIYSIDELSYDKHFQNHERIFRVTTEYQTNSGMDLAMAESFLGISPTLKMEFPEVEESVRVLPYNGDINIQFKSGNSRVFKTENTFRVDKEFFKIFKHEFLDGDEKAFSKPNSIVVTESLSKKWFGDNSPINKAILINDKLYGVVGVINDLPENSDLFYEALISYDFSSYDDDWGNPLGYTYVLLHNSLNSNELESKINLIASEKALSFFVKAYDMKSNIKLSLQPLSTIHFSEQLSGDSIKGNYTYLSVLIALGFLIFLIVIFNHLSFSTSIYTERNHELGVKKVMGISVFSLIRQFVIESSVIAVLVLSISITLFVYLLPIINEIIGKSLPVSYIFDDSLLLILFATFILVVVSGSFYPIFFSFKNTSVLGINDYSSLGSNKLRKTLTAMQLTFTAGLVFFTLTVYSQVDFLRNQDFGFKANNIVLVSLPREVSVESSLTILADKIRRDNLVSEFSLINETSYPGSERLGYQLGWIYNKNNRIEANFNLYEIDSTFTKMLEINFLAGSNFVIQSSKGIHQAVVNNAFVKMAGFASPQSIIGETIHAFDEKIQIVGVTSDFNYQNIHQAVKPLVMVPINPSNIEGKKLLFKLNNPKDLEYIKGLYLELSQDAFDFTFLDDRVKNMFEQEKSIGQIAQIFSLLAILLAIIGLYSLSNLILIQRAKEIGVRKILGISQVSLTYILSKEFLLIFITSFGIAIPLAWYTSQNWLSDFAFRTDIRISNIGLSALMILLILISGIAVNIIRSIRINPVDLLNNE